MKIRHLLLGVAVVALMTACGGNKNAETTTESTPETVTEQVEATVTEEQPVEEPVAEAPAKKSTSTKATAKDTKTTTKTETKAEDPCKAKVAAFSAYVAKLEVAKRDKDAGAKQMKAYKELKAQSRDQENSVKDCATGEYKSVVNSLRTKVKTITM
jgi:hypothetical protein